MCGRIIYYDTRDGECLLDTGYIENYTDNSVVENFYLDLEQQYGNRRFISHKFLNHMEYDEKFKKGLHVRVTPDNELFFSSKESEFHIGIKHNMTDRWHPLFGKVANIYNEEKKTLNGEKLKYYYNDFIEYNLKEVCKVVPVHWLQPTDLKRKNDSNEKALVRWGEGDIPTKERFVEDLINHGFIFPFQTRVINGQHYILDGSHRWIASKVLMERNLWDVNRKIMTLIFDEVNVKYINNEKVNYELGVVLKMHIPKELFNKYHFISFTYVKDFDEYVYEVGVNRYLDMVTMFRMYTLELTDSIYKLLGGWKLINDKDLHPAEVIESESKFNEWIKSNIDVQEGDDD